LKFSQVNLTEQELVMYKTIVVHVDQTEKSAQRIDVAAQLASKYDAHLIGAALTGMSPFVFPIGDVDIAAPSLPLPLEELRAPAGLALDAFETRVRGAGLLSYERRCIDDEPGIGLSMQSRYCDLVVIGQAGQDQILPRLRSDFPEYVLLNGMAPVLVVPAAGVSGELGKKVTVAWNGSPDAARALKSAIPLLQGASLVDLVVYNPDPESGLHGEQPGADMAVYLGRHGVNVQVTVRAAPSNPGDALLAHAADWGSDMIVMGAFGHSRFRELVLGGATRSALSCSTLPLWMAH
jgi:nucleotide-binding universal stress UspA family protein